MRVVDRLLLMVLFLVILAKSFAMLMIGFGWDPSVWLASLGRTVFAEYRVEALVIGLVELIVALYILSWSVRRRYHHEPTITRETGLGRVQISLKAVETLVQRAARQVQGVREVQTDLRMDKQDLDINLILTVAPDLSIPAISEEVQHRIERYIAQTVGVTPTKIQLVFKSVGADTKSRVE
jgi:uncharacterized alkaline shock family protein YloU